MPMQYEKAHSSSGKYRLRIEHTGSDRIVYEWGLWLDATGLAAILRSVDLATNEGQAARSIGLRRKKPKRLNMRRRGKIHELLPK